MASCLLVDCRSVWVQAQYVEIVTMRGGTELHHPAYRAEGQPVRETSGDWYGYCGGCDMQFDRQPLLLPYQLVS